MLVAVRAIAPVAAKPPNNGASRFARPCPTSSWFESCLKSVMPSATTADSSDSIAPSIAIVMAGPTSEITWTNDICGTWNLGRPNGMPPKALPSVATPLKWNDDCSTVATTMATSGPGTCRSPLTRDVNSTIARLSAARASVGR